MGKEREWEKRKREAKSNTSRREYLLVVTHANSVKPILFNRAVYLFWRSVIGQLDKPRNVFTILIIAP